MSTYDAFVPKYDHGIGVPAPKSIAALMKEHQKCDESKCEPKHSGSQTEKEDTSDLNNRAGGDRRSTEVKENEAGKAIPKVI